MSPVARGAMLDSKMDVVEVVTTGTISPNLPAFTLVIMAVVFTAVSSVVSDVVGTCWCVNRVQESSQTNK